ncbi:MAG: hypothetical protein ACPGSD_17320 [Flavobacteriales bacterium]|jgi:hypothetical protein
MRNNHKKIRQIPTKPKGDTVNVSNRFLDFFKTGKRFNTELSIHAGRIIVKIINDLKDDAFKYSNDLENYRTLFDQDLDSDYNSFAAFKFKISEISKSKNTEHVKTALDYLSNYGFDWHESINAQGEKVRTKVGFINVATYSNGYIGFQIPKFWVKRLIDTSFYNKMMYDLAFNLSNSKHFLFHIWLMTLKNEGTKVKLETLNEYFFDGKGYKRYADMNREFLKKVKINLDKYSNTSFNYSYSDNLIHIVPYTVVPNLMTPLKETTSFNIQVTQKINYFRHRNGLEEKDLKHLKIVLKNKNNFDLFLASFAEYKRQCKMRKLPVTHYQGRRFLESLQRYANALYAHTPEGKNKPENSPKFYI